MDSYTEDDFLILTKTYPNPSSKYRETVCVAALTRQGELCRLYPIPERLLSDDKHFSKWDWVRARWITPKDDNRPDSRRIDTDTIRPLNQHIGTDDRWQERLELISPHTLPSYQELEKRRIARGNTLGIVHITRLLGLDIENESSPDYTSEELAKLTRDDLFDSEQVRKRPVLRKLPYRFYYRYECTLADGAVEAKRHLITDWELGALFWNCYRRNSENCLDKVRAKYESEFQRRDLHLLMGTIHRFPDQWLIVGVIYPPRAISKSAEQPKLLLV